MVNIKTIHHSKERTLRLYITNNNKGTMSPTYLSFSEKATIYMRQTKLVDDRYVYQQ